MTCAYLQSAQVRLILVEATGGLASPLVALAASSGLAIAVINPRQARDFAKAIGVLAKTDKVDARVLARFAEAVKPPVRALKADEVLQLAAILTRRRQLIEMITAEGNRKAGAATGIARQIRQHIRWLEKRLKKATRLATRKLLQYWHEIKTVAVPDYYRRGGRGKIAWGGTPNGNLRVGDEQTHLSLRFATVQGLAFPAHSLFQKLLR